MIVPGTTISLTGRYVEVNSCANSSTREAKHKTCTSKLETVIY